MNTLQFQNPMLVILLATGVFVWIMGLIVKRNQPRKINSVYGYRTKRSMKSQKSWDFAQTFSVDLMIKAAILMCVLGLASYFVKINEILGSVIATLMVVLILFIPYIFTEKELREKFGDH